MDTTKRLDSDSVVTRKQKRSYRTEWTDDDGEHVLVAIVRYDDQCGNGHNTFSITGELYSQNGDKRGGREKTRVRPTFRLESCGCVHDIIAARIPKLAPFIRWHLCSSDGPLHYIANTLWFAGDRDCWGLRLGERRQLRKGGTGLPSWVLKVDKDLPTYVDAETQPSETATLRYVPWYREGEGKERELDAARRAAVWPEATDEELMQEPKALEAALLARLPGLLREFRAAVESLGFVY
jgi:hypothetical protein